MFAETEKRELDRGSGGWRAVAEGDGSTGKRGTVVEVQCADVGRRGHDGEEEGGKSFRRLAIARV
jgi:hypothetical protein